MCRVSTMGCRESDWRSTKHRQTLWNLARFFQPLAKDFTKKHEDCNLCFHLACSLYSNTCSRPRRQAQIPLSKGTKNTNMLQHPEKFKVDRMFHWTYHHLAKHCAFLQDCIRIYCRLEMKDQSTLSSKTACSNTTIKRHK